MRPTKLSHFQLVQHSDGPESLKGQNIPTAKLFKFGAALLHIFGWLDKQAKTKGILKFF